MNQTKTSNKSRIDAGGKQGGKWRWAVGIVVIEDETVAVGREQAPVRVFRAGNCELDAANYTSISWPCTRGRSITVDITGFMIIIMSIDKWISEWHITILL